MECLEGSCELAHGDHMFQVLLQWIEVQLEITAELITGGLAHDTNFVCLMWKTNQPHFHAMQCLEVSIRKVLSYSMHIYEGKNPLKKSKFNQW